MKYREMIRRYGAAAAAAAVLAGSMAIPASVKAGSFFDQLKEGVLGEEEETESDNPLGTVTDGTHTIWLGESMEQVIEELGEPSDGKTFGNIPIAKYPGLSIFYRDYGKLKASGKMPWVDSYTTQAGVDMRVAMISFMPPEDAAAILATENNYLTVDNLRLGAFLTPLLDDPEANLIHASDASMNKPESGVDDPIVYISKIWYDGSYYTEEDWKALLASASPQDKARKQMEMTKIWYETSNGETISRITVADESAALYMR